MARLFIFLAALQLVLFALALIDCLSADRVRTLPRPLWVVVVLLFPVLGPISYFGWGRVKPAPHENAPVRRSASRPSSPDDDPDFLRAVNSEQSRRDRELLAQWENELKNRDDE